MKPIIKKTLRGCLVGVLGMAAAGTAYANLAGFNSFQLNGNQNAQNAGLPIIGSGDASLKLMDGPSGIAVSAWHSTPQTYINGFIATFTYRGGFQSGEHHGIADGFTFALQNSPTGIFARGNDGGALGFEGGGEFELANAVGMGGQIAGGSYIGYVKNHSYPQNKQKTTDFGGVRLDFSNENDGGNVHDPVVFTVTYNPSVNDSVLSVVAVQGTNTFSFAYDVGESFQSILGGTTAYVGFTGGAGGDTSSQVISDFSYVEMMPPALPSVQPFTGNGNGFRAAIIDADGATPNINTITLTLDGVTVAPTSITQDGAGRTLVAYQNNSMILDSGSSHTASIHFTGTGFIGSVDVTNTFTVPAYKMLTSEYKASGPVNVNLSGFVGRIHQLPILRYPDANNLIGVERQLANGFIDPNTGQPYASTLPISAFTNEVLNWFLYAPYEETGFFRTTNVAPANVPDLQVPGLTDIFSIVSSNLAAEILTVLDLPAGSYRLGVLSADVFKLSVGSEPRDVLKSVVLSSSEIANQEVTADITVATAGKYPVRLVFGERLDNAQLEFYLVDFNTGKRVLINDRSNTGFITAYADMAAFNQPYCTSVSPAPGGIAGPDAPIIVTIVDGTAATVAAGSVRLTLDGVGTAAVSKIGNKTTVTLNHALLAGGSTATAQLVYDTSLGAHVTNTWQFSVPTYQVLPSSLATPVSSGVADKPGFRVKAFQASRAWLTSQNGIATDNNNDLNFWITAAQGLWGQGVNVANLSAFTDNGFYDLTGPMNFNQSIPGGAGFFADTAVFPYLPSTEGNANNSMMEALTYIKFPAAGYYEMGVNSDDGFEVTVGDSHGGPTLMTVSAPAGIAKSYGAFPSRGYADSMIFPQVTGRVVVADPIDMGGPNTNLLVNADAFRGNIVLFYRVGPNEANGGGADTRMLAAQSMGAIGVIEVWTTNSWPQVDNPSTTIPCVTMWNSDGNAIAAQCTSGNNSPVFATIGGGDKAQVLGSYQGGRGSMPGTVFGVYAPQAGLYPIRLLYFNGGGDITLEWWSMDSNGVRHLVGDSADADALVAYRARTVSGGAPNVKVTRVNGDASLSWTGVGELQYSSSVTGPYFRTPSQSNPQTNAAQFKQIFYRVRQY